MSGPARRDGAQRQGAPVTAQRSLRFRLLAATLAALAVALVLAGLWLNSLFRDHVMRQMAQSLTAQLDQVTARLAFDAAGQPQIDAAGLSDPRWVRPYSGLYWQVDGLDRLDRPDAGPAGDAAAAPAAQGALRSRSLWDTTLQPPADTPADGEVHVHELTGPQGATLLLVERTVAVPALAPDAAAGPGPTRWRLLVAADLADTAAAIASFRGTLAASLAVLGVLLAAAAVAQVAVGLAPLRALQRALQAVHAGRQPRLADPVPAEVQPLVDDFNRVLDRNAEVVARARTQAGNLAHALKTPLAALAQAAATAPRSAAGAAELAALVHDQVQLARRHIDGHLARARAAAAHGLPGARAPVRPTVEGLLRVMTRVHADRGLHFDSAGLPEGLHFAGEAQDLQEMAGNLIDNACKWARQRVQVSAWTEIAAPGLPGASAASEASGPRLHLVVEDDGPGIAPAQRTAALARGARLDEAVPGSGLGLAIVQELAALYGGSLQLGAAATGGLRAELQLPAA